MVVQTAVAAAGGARKCSSSYCFVGGCSGAASVGLGACMEATAATVRAAGCSMVAVAAHRGEGREEEREGKAVRQ